MNEQQNVIVVGASARAAAFSALRAGWRPYAIDLFADSDLADVCPAVRIERYPQDFEKALADGPQAPWIYTGGLENHPDLVDRLAAIRPLSGNGAEVLRKIRDPRLLAACLVRAKVNFALPEVRDAIPPPGTPQGPVEKGVWLGASIDFAGRKTVAATCLTPFSMGHTQWLRKPRRSSGGLGIRRTNVNEELESGANDYYQAEMPGIASSAIFLAHPDGCRLLGLTQQHCGVADFPDQPFLYAGSSTGHLRREADWQYRGWLEDLGQLLAREFGLRGLFNLDLVGDHWLLEVNPRYSASVEVLEHASGENFLALHMAAFDASVPEIMSRSLSRNPSHVAKQIVYATGDCLVTPAVQELRRAWNREPLFPGLADIPRSGERILRGQPVATVIAEGGSSDEVQRLLSERVMAVQQSLTPERTETFAPRHGAAEENVA